MTFQISQGKGHSTLRRSMFMLLLHWQWPQIEGIDLLINFVIYSRLISVNLKKIHKILYFLEFSRRNYWTDSRTEEHFIHSMYASISWSFLNMYAWNCSVVLFALCNLGLWVQYYWWRIRDFRHQVLKDIFSKSKQTIQINRLVRPYNNNC